jgi:hypothetical protein
VAIIIGLLFWLNLIARIVLLSACWAYLDTAHETAEEAEEAEGADPGQDEGVAAGAAVQNTTVRLIPPSTAAAGVADPTVGRSRDRVAVMAGAVIGAAVATGVAGLLRRRSSR